MAKSYLSLVPPHGLPKDDFISFPTLPDPEVAANRSISTIIQSTLRKVTNNASQLVHNYTAENSGPHDHFLDASLLKSRSLASVSSPLPEHLTPIPVEPTTTKPSDPAINRNNIPPPLDLSAHAQLASMSAPVLIALHSHSALASPRLLRFAKVTLAQPAQLSQPPPPSTGPTQTPLQATPNPPPVSTLGLSPKAPLAPAPDITSLGIRLVTSAPQAPSGSPSQPTFARQQVGVTTPRLDPFRVTSDNRGLRISMPQVTRHADSSLNRRDVTIVRSDHLKHVDKESANAESKVIDLSEPSIIQVQESVLPEKTVVTSLQNRISSIFNNLPNDIEVSDDDSASDLEAADQSLTALGNAASGLRAPSRKPSSTIRSTKTSSSSMKSTPQRDVSVKETLQNVSISILNGAKSLLASNIPGKSDSSSSTSKPSSDNRQKKVIRKVSRASENPLKNGGIPRKYWMNDSFVSDCLNCFKAFTAFRRKHHCRFCGQIFCAKCTIFILYSYYKQQRRGSSVNKVLKSHKDKLRVCKPCYSDVVVYLSDDSSSDLEHETTVRDPEVQVIDDINVSYGGESQLSSMRVALKSRLRSLSITSGIASIYESSSLARKTSETEDSLGSPSHTSGTSEPQQRSPDGYRHRHPPRMAIPTTRTGESVEISVPNSVFSQNASSNSYFTLIHPNYGPNINNVLGAESLDSRFNSMPRHFTSAGPDLSQPKSLDNLSSLYKAVVHKRFSRIPSNQSLERVARNIKLTHKPIDDMETYEVESENEDEKAMSLYAALNDSGTSSVIPIRPQNQISASLPGVPTLHEFPAMDGKYMPTNLNDADAIKRFEFKPTDSFTNSTMSENRERSTYRSNERAKASLRRIKDRRIHKQELISHGSSTRIPGLDATLPHLVNTHSSPFISSPISRAVQPSTQDDSLASSNTSISQRRELPSPQTPILGSRASEDKSLLRMLLYSLDEAQKLADSGFLTSINDPHRLNTILETEFKSHLHRMIQQCLTDCDIKTKDDQDRWVAVLDNILDKIGELNVADTLDVRQYIKIKKILGGSIEDTRILDGLFITKNIDSKRMRSLIENPKIALLVFPLEYLKQKEQFISLRIVKSQQLVYITNLVSRLVSLEPDIVIVGDSVCGFAEKLLEEANITVISNVKPQVIERISRYTKGLIYQSVNDLFFKKGALGTCSAFEIRRFLYKDLIKTYAFFEGTKSQEGFTICLRGGDEEYLSSAKYAAESLIPGALNARFEKSFLRDLGLVSDLLTQVSTELDLRRLVSTTESVTEAGDDAKSTCVKSIHQYGVINYLQLFGERMLTYSPSVNYPLPKTLDKVIKSYLRFVDFNEFNERLQAFSDLSLIDNEVLKRLEFDMDLNRLQGEKNILLGLKFVGKSIFNTYLQSFQYRMRLWSNSMKYTTYQLYPIFHKSIHLLHSRVSIKHATPCYGPVVVVIDLYSDNDKCLGLFLDQQLQESSRICDECGDLHLNHYKTYAHGNAKIDLIIEKFEDSRKHEFREDQRLMWSYCPKCNASSPIRTMTDETYLMSLGKFFELSFWSTNILHDHDCKHDYFKEHVKYFGLNGYYIRMEFSKIDTYEVIVPRKKLEFSVLVELRLKIETLERIQKSSSEFFQSVSKRLTRVKIDTFDRAEDGREKISELKSKLDLQQAMLTAKITQIYESTMPTNYLTLNIVQRDLQGLGVEWDREFSDFEKEFLPTENEINKITQFHLRNFLIDRLDTDTKPQSEFEDITDENTEEHTESKSPDVTLPDTKLMMSNENSPSQDRISSKAPSIKRLPLAVIEDKIMQIQQSLEHDQNKHTVSRSPSKLKTKPFADLNLGDYNGPSVPNKVQDLTNYFNQMTFEFKKQREEELEKQSSKYKALPIVKSQPIIEIYDNIEDVVDVHRKQTALAKSTPSLEADDVGRASSDNVEPGEENEKKLDSTSKPFNEALKARLDIPQPEKNSLLKSLTNFWADRSATLWDPLKYSLDYTEHTFADSDVIVREDEPTSLVAFCLSTSDYKLQMSGMTKQNSPGKGQSSDANFEFGEQYQEKEKRFSKIERKFKKRSGVEDDEITALEATMNKAKFNHLKYQFFDGNTEMSCKIFFSEHFDAFRKACGIEDMFVQSLSRCVKWNSSGGKSGSNFLKTLDNRFVVKELSKSELESFVSIAPFYFKYIAQSTFNTLTTALAKIFGFYQVEFKNSMNGKVFKMDFLIMENLFYNRKTTRIFDLKGSMRNRHVKQTGMENEVLLDENMIEYIYESPVFVLEQLKKLLRGSLFNDTSFLSAMDVMDYSLVIGLDDQSGKLYVGIIDWLRTFTWDKKVENWVKGKSLVGKKGKDPTIVTPKQYRVRFREAMDRYILEVPDIWYEGSN